VTDEEFEEILALGHENSNVEFKGPGLLKDKHFCARVVKAILGMANRRDGGRVVIGVSDTSSILDCIGLSEAEFASWRFDDVSAVIATYADPYVRFDLFTHQVNNKKFVVLQVYEFDDIPVICKEKYEYKKQDGTYEQVLREGALYVRTRRKPETTEIPSQTEMRDLLEIATEKGVKKFIGQANAAGLNLSEVAQTRGQDLFYQQIENITDPLIEKIQSRGFWKVIIRPTKFIEERIPDFTMLYPLIQKTSVNLRGFSFPYTGGDMKYQSGNDWVGEEFEWDWVHEAWRFFQSGQFVHISGLLEDWHDVSKWNSAPEGWVPGRTLSVVSDLKGRHLFLSSSRWMPLPDRYDIADSAIPFTSEYSKEDIIANPGELALQYAMKLFQRFKWNSSKEFLQDIQSRIGRFF
jgi:Putative DNA-binding domain